MKHIMGECMQLTKEEEIAHYHKMKEGDKKSREVLIVSQIPWAICLANRFCKKYKWRNLEEALSAAYEGCIRAVDKFNPEKGRLATYSRNWILRDIMEARRKDRCIRVPQGAWLPNFKHEEDAARAMKIGFLDPEKKDSFLANAIAIW